VRGKRRRFSAEAAARHLQSARVHTDPARVHTDCLENLFFAKKTEYPGADFLDISWIFLCGTKNKLEIAADLINRVFTIRLVQ